MQYTRGFIHFPKKFLEEIKKAFDNYSDNLNIYFFQKINRYGEEHDSPGIFISGQVDDSYTSESLIYKLQQKAGVEKQIQKCDISVESEDYMHYVREGDIGVRYIGLRIKPPYEPSQLKSVAEKLGNKVNATDIFIRGVEKEKAAPSACIDLITKENYALSELNELILTDQLEPGEVVYFDLIK